jgi:hypothetical protein
MLLNLCSLTHDNKECAFLNNIIMIITKLKMAYLYSINREINLIKNVIVYGLHK